MVPRLFFDPKYRAFQLRLLLEDVRESWKENECRSVEGIDLKYISCNMKVMDGERKEE